MNTYNIISQSDASTVVSEYIPEKRNSTAYQSEDALEKDFISRLTKQGYEYIDITNEEDLIKNLRLQIERLNAYNFSDKEWNSFYTEVIASNNSSIVEKTKIIQEDHVQLLKCDNGNNKNIKLIDKQDIHNNHVQVINQFEQEKGTRKNRYDVTILVNGFPLVHVELKRRGVAIREAFNQINRYQRDSFWAGSGLYEYIQLFVISNGTQTKYYSNTTRNQHINDKASSKKKSKTSNSFEFTSFWSDASNKTIPDLVDFTKTFFAKHSLLNVLIRYCVFTSENLLLVMRPYQIVATERIINRIETACSYKKMGDTEAGGYIWHTTGSGKTLTSFKTAQLASRLPYIKKVLFVVDRKDLDYQTMKEYDRFEKGAANANVSTNVLTKQIEDPNARIIITTIQKLDNFLRKNKGHDIYKEHIVLIFDECHRSQFGDMHKNITSTFKNYHIFGFTGTPIFAQNAGKGKFVNLRTTEQAFGDKLHSYTIIDAIHDRNVLPFRIDYINTFKLPENIKDAQVKNIDTEKALSSPIRIEGIVKYILEHFDQKTYRKKVGSEFNISVIDNVSKMASSKHNTVEEIKVKRRVDGFNSIFAVDSIPMAMKYYTELKKQLDESNNPLRIATIFSYNPNEQDPNEDNIFEDEDFDTSELDATSRDFLDKAIKDYNSYFNTSYDTTADKFPNYYKDVSLRMKNREIDLLIVVNMFLTGFDATTLNTLWVDKNLKQHGLVQAYSRTNRILNSLKTFGNIVCFRDLEKATNDALALFGNKEARGIVLLKSFKDYFEGYADNDKHVAGYRELVERLLTEYPIGTEIIGESAELGFIKLFGAILRLRNILVCFDEFKANDILDEGTLQDYQSIYNDLYEKYKKMSDVEKENINADIIFEVELIKQISITIDYIIMLVKKYADTNCKDKEILVDIKKNVNSSIELRSKKELIENFINSINASSDIDQDWIKFVNAQKDYELKKLIDEEKLKEDKTIKFIENAFRDGIIKTTGVDIDSTLPTMSRFASADSGKQRAEKKKVVIEKFLAFFEKYFGLV